MDDGYQGQIVEKSAVRRRLPPRPESMQLGIRDGDVVRWIYEVQLATRKHVQDGFFTEGGRSRCQRRLTLLYRNRYLDKLPGQPVNAPDIYYISRRATNGLRLLRASAPEEAIRPHRTRPGQVQHTLDLASCRVCFDRACSALGFTVSGWLGTGELSQRMEKSGLLPDAYVRITRPTAAGPKTPAFFVEVERTGKSAPLLEEKIRRYRDFYDDGGYEEIFHTKALRILVLFGAEYGVTPQRQIQRYSKLAEQVGVTFFRLASLPEFLDQSSDQLLVAPIWQRPGEASRVPLFTRDS